MAERSSFPDRADIVATVNTLLERADLPEVQRLTGGSKKGVYRFEFSNGDAVVVYVWNEEENYWPARTDDGGDLFGDASGVELFLASHRALSEVGVRVPAVLGVARDVGGNTDIAAVEDLRGGTLSGLLETGGPAAGATVRRLRPYLDAMFASESPTYGKVARIGIGEGPQPLASSVVFGRAAADLDAACRILEPLARARSQVSDALEGLHAAASTPGPYCLIHGELGPDHVLLDSYGTPVLIDIEGAMYFHAEWEHAFLELRFGHAYDQLRIGGLNEDRLRLYRLCLYLSLVAGPLRLIEGDFPDRAGMTRIIDANLNRVLATAGCAAT